MNDRIRTATYTKEFDDEIMLTKYVVSTTFVKRLEKTEFYEMRVS